MQLRKLKKKLLQYTGLIISRPIIDILCYTLRIKEKNLGTANNIIQNNSGVVFAFWHGKMLVPWFKLKRFKPTTIISQSKDGDILAHILQSWKYKVFRGSSSKDGKEILEQLVNEAFKGEAIAITPDGPKGPANKMKAGASIISKKAEVPIILVGAGYKNKHKLKSWDEFEIPYFFSKVNIVYSEPYYLNKDSNYESTNLFIEELSENLNKIQLEAEKFC